MANQNPVVPTVATVPGNLSGSLAGAAATVAVGWLASAGYLAAVAAFVGLPVDAVAVAAMAVVGGIFNYGVTHIAAIKSLNALYAALPKSYAEYPAQPQADIPLNK